MGNNFEEQGQRTLPNTQMYDKALVFQTVRYWHSASTEANGETRDRRGVCLGTPYITEEVLQIGER